MKVFIAGASSDIGIATCKKYLSMGWDVLAHYRTTREQLLQLEVAYPGEISFINADLSDMAGFINHLETNEAKYSLCDTLVNCAGVANPKKYEEISESDLIEHIRINTLPNILLTQYFSKFMLQRQWGRIVYLSSVGVKFGGGLDNYCYSMSKLLSEFFPAVAKKTWAQNNVLINTVRAGVIDTRFHQKFQNKSMADRASLIPAKRLGLPAEVAEAIYFLGSGSNTFTTCEVMSVSGGE